MARPARKKKDIERAALELFADHGIDGTTIRMIAERAGVTEGALYRHHKSKDDLVRALFEEYFESFGGMLEGIRADAAPVEDRIGQMVRAFLAAYDTDPLGFRFVMLVQHGLLDGIRKDALSPAKVLTRFIEEAIDRGEIPKQDASLKAQLLMGMVMQVAVGERYGRLKAPVAGYAEQVSAAAVAALRAV